MHQRERYWGLRHFWSVLQLAYEQVISNHQSLLHRGGWNCISLKKEHSYEGCCNNCKYKCINPLYNAVCLATLCRFLSPEGPFHFFGNIYVENHSEAQKPPIISKPYYPKEIQTSPKCKLKPSIFQETCVQPLFVFDLFTLQN